MLKAPHGRERALRSRARPLAAATRRPQTAYPCHTRFARCAAAARALQRSARKWRPSPAQRVVCRGPTLALAAMAALRSRASAAAVAASAASASLAATAAASCADSELAARSRSRPSACRLSSSSAASLPWRPRVRVPAGCAPCLASIGDGHSCCQARWPRPRRALRSQPKRVSLELSFPRPPRGGLWGADRQAAPTGPDCWPRQPCGRQRPCTGPEPQTCGPRKSYLERRMVRPRHAGRRACGAAPPRWRARAAHPPRAPAQPRASRAPPRPRPARAGARARRRPCCASRLRAAHALGGAARPAGHARGRAGAGWAPATTEGADRRRVRRRG